MKLSNVKMGDIFKIGDVEFIKFEENDGTTVAVAKDCLFRSEFGKDNNFANSKILKRLEKEILPQIENEIGAENVLNFETDLLSLDGSDIHGKMQSKISLPTFDFYRKNVKIFDKYKIDAWWWLSTPDSTIEHLNNNWIVCVSPFGGIGRNYYGFSDGVRPVLHFVSSISVSCED